MSTTRAQLEKWSVITVIILVAAIAAVLISYNSTGWIVGGSTKAGESKIIENNWNCANATAPACGGSCSREQVAGDGTLIKRFTGTCGPLKEGTGCYCTDLTIEIAKTK